MKKGYIISWLAFAFGIILKFLHLPFAGTFLSIGTFLIVVHSIFYFIKYGKENLLIALLYFSIALMTIYILERLQFWRLLSFTFLLAFLSSLTCIIILIVKKVRFGNVQRLFLIYFIFFDAMYFIPAYSVYYFIYLNTFLNSDSRNTDYFGWDKYSWFLYRYDKQTEALEANQNAKNAIYEIQKIQPNKKAEEYLILINEHEHQIREKNWTFYPQR